MCPALVIAQADMAGMPDATFQQQLLEHSQFIAWLYGGVFVVGFILLVAFTLRIQSHPLDWSLPWLRLLERPWVWRDAAGIILPLLVLQLLFMTLWSFWKPDGNTSQEDIERMALWMQGILFHWVCFFMVVVLMARRGIGWREAFGISVRDIPGQFMWGALILLMVMPILIAYNVAAQVVMQWWGIPPQVQDVTRIISGASGWPEKLYFVSLAVVVAPVVEEMLFRGILLPALARLVGVRPALLLVAFLFAIVHGLYMPSAVIFFILSIAFSLAYLYRGTLTAPIVMHALFNGLTMIVLLRI